MADSRATNRPEELDHDALLARVKVLRRAVDELTVLNELATEIGASFDSGEVIAKIVKRSRRSTNAEQAVVTLLERESTSTAETLWRDLGSAPDRERYHLGRHLLGWMLHNRKPLLSNDPHRDDRVRGAHLPHSVRSVLCVPLLLRAEVIGVLAVFNKHGDGGFDQEDQRLLAIIAMQSAQVVENARLHEQSKHFDGVREELRLAREIQQQLLPKSAPEVEGYELAGASEPALDVGGDYYDYVPLEDGRLVVALGDVSGKGLPASLLMANLQAALRGQVLFEPSAAACARRMNHMLHRCTAAHCFTTLFLGILDPKEHTMTCCNAGHEHPLLWRQDGELLRPDAGGLPLGVLDDFDYEEQTVGFEPGDLLLIYSDGVTDAEAVGEEPFGERRLLDAVAPHRGSAARTILDRVNDAVHAHTRGAEPVDDVTLLVLARTT